MNMIGLVDVAAAEIEVLEGFGEGSDNWRRARLIRALVNRMTLSTKAYDPKFNPDYDRQDHFRAHRAEISAFKDDPQNCQIDYP